MWSPGFLLPLLLGHDPPPAQRDRLALDRDPGRSVVAPSVALADRDFGNGEQPIDDLFQLNLLGPAPAAPKAISAGAGPVISMSTPGTSGVRAWPFSCRVASALWPIRMAGAPVAAP